MVCASFVFVSFLVAVRAMLCYVLCVPFTTRLTSGIQTAEVRPVWSVDIKKDAVPDWLNFTIDVTSVYGTSDAGAYLRIPESLVPLGAADYDKPWWSWVNTSSIPHSRTLQLCTEISASNGVCRVCMVRGFFLNLNNKRFYFLA